jgi:hypothetical protein
MQVKDEVGSMFKRAFVAHLTYYLSIYVAELRDSGRYVSISSLGQGSNTEPPEYEARSHLRKYIQFD